MHFEKKMAALQQDSRLLSSLKLGITRVRQFEKKNGVITASRKIKHLKLSSLKFGKYT